MNKFIVILLLASNIVLADVSLNQAKEINHLLEFVRNSGCTINRNGTEHSAEKGIRHIEKKYNYFRDDINSTEDFIKLSATKSTMSGDYYTVKCLNKKMINTQDWLLIELKRFRKQ